MTIGEAFEVRIRCAEPLLATEICDEILLAGGRWAAREPSVTDDLSAVVLRANAQDADALSAEVEAFLQSIPVDSSEYGIEVVKALSGNCAEPGIAESDDDTPSEDDFADAAAAAAHIQPPARARHVVGTGLFAEDLASAVADMQRAADEAMLEIESLRSAT